MAPRGANGEDLDRALAGGQGVIMSDAVHTTTRTLETTDVLVLKAPQLLGLVRLMFRVRTNPDDKSSYIQLKLMAQRGLDRCPSCEAALVLEGYRRTRTEFAEREVLACRGCRTTFVLHERHVA